MEENIYSSPQSDLGNDAQGKVIADSNNLAPRFDRFIAAIIDAIISLIIVVPILYFSGNMNYFTSGEEPPFLTTLLETVLYFIVFIIVHGYLLKSKGQTIGKKFPGIKIVSMNNELLSLKKLLLRRYLPVSIISIIPEVGIFVVLINYLFIFGPGRRCLHDYICGTQVVMK